MAACPTCHQPATTRSWEPALEIESVSKWVPPERLYACDLRRALINPDPSTQFGPVGVVSKEDGTDLSGKQFNVPP
jgi:hypothetical protein